jgi:glycosyltransferase involved in cell wall biosynthesis
VSYDIVVVDDHSVDGGRAVVQEFIDTHPDVPLLLLGCETNRGLSAARNLAIEHARATKLMMLDADNELYPSCLKALSAALDGDSGAAFAYGTIEDFGVTPGVRSAMAWHVPWLCERNYIDAQAMIRRSVFERHGGYRLESEWAYGWEDWELWLRLAAAGEYGVHVPNFVGRYRTQASSMLTITNLVHDRMLADLRASYPLLAWPAS